MVRYLLIDGMNFTYAAWHAYSKLTNEGKPSSIVFGVPSMLDGLVNSFHPQKIYVVWDGKKHPHRMSLLPDYKKRDKRMDEVQVKMFYEQKDKVQELLDALGIRQVHNITMEADDYIYELAKRKMTIGSVIIASTDKDFHQLLTTSRISIWNNKLQKILTKRNLNENFNYEPHQCVDYLSLVGDDSDNIPGYRGVGEKKAMALLSRYASIKEYIDGKDNFLKLDLKELDRVRKVNRELIDLAWFNKNVLGDNVPIKMLNPRPEFNLRKLTKICNEYNIRKFLKPEFIKNYE